MILTGTPPAPSPCIKKQCYPGTGIFCHRVFERFVLTFYAHFNNMLFTHNLTRGALSTIRLKPSLERVMAINLNRMFYPAYQAANPASSLDTFASNPTERGQVLLWAANERNSARLASESSDAAHRSTRLRETEGRLAKTHPVAHPILFLLRQDGTEEHGWRGTPFCWPVIRAQSLTPTAMYTAETID